MSTYLIGGGWSEDASALVYGPFLKAAGADPVVACLLIDEGDGAEQFTLYESVLRKVAPCTPMQVLGPLGGAFDPASLDQADALLVGGGLTPAYHDALIQVRTELPELLAARGMPYAGFSAGGGDRFARGAGRRLALRRGSRLFGGYRRGPGGNRGPARTRSRTVPR